MRIESNNNNGGASAPSQPKGNNMDSVLLVWLAIGIVYGVAMGFKSLS
jgi:hypothetical protein